MAKKAAKKKTPTRKEKSAKNKAKHKNVATLMNRDKKKTTKKGKTSPKVKLSTSKGPAINLTTVQPLYGQHEPVAKKARRDWDEDKLLDMITDGYRYEDIANEFGRSTRELYQFLAEDGIAARAREAIQFTAHKFEQMAEDVLRAVPITKVKNRNTWLQMEQAKQLAQHYRWRASKRFPKGYGDRVEHAGEITVKQITGMSVT